ncbi:hypothetical protein NT01EI_2934 [Edwardsiella ictaluri 93-146]|uniref:Inosine-uridine preferring nucleoside hydrolase n=1 Tax=Edwardsiella ictaluri (strain 93-146) TaxID=634503 RepID=C5BGC5_EDWI9|nr:hypothetical protein NT01EI_2934 [Edwardsiella ictaluri 93-146]
METRGRYTTGMTVVDAYVLSGNAPNATVLLDVDRQAFVDLLAERIATYGDMTEELPGERR